MPLLQDFPDRSKKRLKFYCTNCGAEIITQYLKPGDKLICRFCIKETTVPPEAIDTQEESTIRAILKKESDEEKTEHVEAKKELSEPPLPTPWGVLSVVKFFLAQFVLFTFLSCVIGAIFAFFIYATIPEVRNDQELFHTIYTRLVNKIIAPIGWITSLGLVYYIVVKRHKNNFFPALNLTRPSREIIAKYATVAAYVAATVLVLSLLIYFTPLNEFIPEDIPIEEIFKEGYSGLVWLSIIALLAPIPEEIVFRGFIYKGLKPKLGHIGSGIIVTVLFILLHGPQLGFGILYLILIAIIAVTLIIVRIRTDSLTNCIIVHLLYNTVLIFVAWSCVFIFGIESLTQ